MTSHRFFVALALLAFSVSPGFAQPVEVIDEDFEAGSIDGQTLGNTLIQDVGDGRSTILRLTQGVNEQQGSAWFATPFNLRENKVTIDFDVWVRPGTSSPPADGMSVIFQFGSNTSAVGSRRNGGSGLGTCDFPTPYVSVAFDIYDSGDLLDPETLCDDGTPHTCHVEVNQNICPGLQASTQTNVSFGVAAPDFTVVGATLAPIHVTIVFDSGAIQVDFQTDGDARFADPVTVLKTSLRAFPDPADAIIGFAASTGGANAHHEIDNLVVAIDDPTPRVSVVTRLGNGDRGAINCGSTTEVTGSVAGQTYTFVPDVRFDTFVGTNDTVVPNQDLYSGYGYVAGDNPAGPSANPIDNVGAASLENMYQTERWMEGGIAYRFAVNSGRFEVNLHFAETCAACGVGAGGEATRRIHARLEGEEALTHWSAALAAGEEAGTGPTAFRAVVRTFQVDVDDGLLDVAISDLGLLATTPPENAQLNGISYRRLGAATGAAIAGDIEYRGPVELPAQETIELVQTDFEADAVDACPAGWSCNGGQVTPPFAPGVVNATGRNVPVDNRLRLTDNGVGATGVAATAIWSEPADLGRYDFTAEFDFHLTRDLLNTGAPADGMTFFFLPGDETALTRVGAAGGSLAYSGIGATSGFAVELDTYDGGDPDPNGFNEVGFGHIGLVVNGDVTLHLQHNIAMDPGTVPPSWPIALVTDPADPEVGQFLTGTDALESADAAGIHVEVELNNDRFRVWISTVNQEPADGFVYPRTQVIDTLLGYGTSGLGQGYFGFSAATGGAVAWHEVDNVEISLVSRKEVQVARTLSATTYSGQDTPVGATLSLDVLEGTGAHSVQIVETLPAGWTATGISHGGAFAAGAVTWNLSGLTSDTAVTYTIVPDDVTDADAFITGTFAVDGGPALPVGTSTLRYAPAPFPRGAAESFIDAFFDDEADGECPPGWTCNGGRVTPPFAPGVTQAAGFEGRLRLTDSVASTTSTVIWNEPLDLSRNSFVAEFDAFLSLSDGTVPADGLTFMVLDAAVSSPTALGVGGSGEGYQGLSGFAVELDLYLGTGDPSGYNANGYAHMAVIRDGLVDSHVQTHLQLNPAFVPTTAGGTGWPGFVDTAGTGIPLHVEVDYNNGRVQVFLSAPATGAEPEFVREKVLDTTVLFPGSGGVDPVLQSAYVGFSGATGGSYATHEVDDVQVTVYAAEGGGGGFVRADSNADGGINITDGIFVLNYLFLGGGTPPCLDAADANDDGAVNITDGIYILNFLFLGGGEPPAPYPLCGADSPGDDGVTCDSFPPCP